ncbi:M3 family metallopeptidase, partial [Jeotgalibaca porci]
MEKQELKKRSEVPVELTWDLEVLFATRAEYETALTKMEADVAEFAETFTGALNNAEVIVEAIKAYEAIQTQVSVLYHYANLPAATDLTNADYTQMAGQFDNKMATVSATLSFFDSELTQVPEEILDAVVEIEPLYASFIRHTKADKHIQLTPEVEKALAQLSPTLYAPESIYDQAKLADMDFGTFAVDGEDYPLSFVLYEDFYMYHTDTAIRRAAFDAFSKVLKQYENVIAQAYYSKVQTEKTLATMRGFDSIFDYLLYNQEVDQDLYNRQIDVIMSDLAPVMRKYITHLKEVQGLDKVTYADLKIDLDPEYSPKVTIEDSQKMVADAVSILGEEYTEMIMRAYPERWVDFAQNTGKSTGGFCTSVSANKAHPYILMSWTN